MTITEQQNVTSIKSLDLVKMRILCTMDDWQGYWFGYHELCSDTGHSIKECKAAMKELKETGYVVHSPMVDHDDRPKGSGWFLTSKINNLKRR